MLELVIKPPELWDERNEEFINLEPVTIQVEHSLESLAAWESKWHKPFLGQDERSKEETIDYIKCMTLTPNVDPKIYDYLDNTAIKSVSKYIEDSMTATWFTNRKLPPASSEQVTAEIIYYWMIAFNVPFECAKWHLNRLLTLIRVCEAKSRKAEKIPRNEQLRSQTALNKARRQKYKTRG